jgi:hypothetical protein
MGCGTVINKERRVVGFVCGRGITPCGECGSPSDYLCDFPTGDGNTCDIPLCGFHSCEVGEDKHFCPIHTAMFRATGASKLIERGKLEIVK